MAIGDRFKAIQIKANLISDDRVRLMEIDAQVHGHIAVLSGDVETEEQKALAEELACQVDGIHEVENHIRVVKSLPEQESAYDGFEPRLGYGPTEGDAGDTPFSLSNKYSVPGPGIPASEQFPGEFPDNVVREEVSRALASQKDVDISLVTFDVEDQIVRLRGRVQTSDDLRNIQDMVLRLRGVIGVDSQLEVCEGDTGTQKM